MCLHYLNFTDLLPETHLFFLFDPIVGFFTFISKINITYESLAQVLDCKNVFKPPSGPSGFSCCPFLGYGSGPR